MMIVIDMVAGFIHRLIEHAPFTPKVNFESRFINGNGNLNDVASKENSTRSASSRVSPYHFRDIARLLGA